MDDICSINVEKITVTGILFQFTLPLTIEMPCGKSFTADSLDDLKQDVPCPCGNLDHWIVRWDEA